MKSGNILFREEHTMSSSKSEIPNSLEPETVENSELQLGRYRPNSRAMETVKESRDMRGHRTREGTVSVLTQ